MLRISRVSFGSARHTRSRGESRA